MTQTLLFDPVPLPPPTPREQGVQAAAACLDKAERTAEFDTAAARAFILDYLRLHGPTSGETLTDAAIAAGHRPHDGRAYGPLFQSLIREKQIRQVGWCRRRKGHGCAGGAIYERT